MPVSFAGGTMKRLEGLHTDFPHNILIDPDLNGRHEHTAVEELAADIEKNGQIQPAGIRKNEAGEAVLIYGHRRYRAIALLNERNPNNLRKIVCNYYAVDEAEAFAMAIGENRFRREVSPIDDCANIVMLRKRFGKTDEDIARIYFPEAKDLVEPLRFVKQRAALIELSAEGKQAVRDGRVKLTAAVALAKLSKDQQRAKLRDKGKIKTADVTPPKEPSAAAKRIAAAPSSDETKLRGLVALLLDDVAAVDLNSDKKYIEVSREALVELSEFMG